MAGHLPGADFAAARDLASSILNNRRGRLAIIHGPQSSETSSQRLNGVLSMCAERGYVARPEDIVEAALSMESGYQGATEVLGSGEYAAVFRGNDQIACGVYRRCRELGLSVPDDIRIYGFDDNPLNEWLAPWLNTVRVPHVAYAEAAVRQMQTLTKGGNAKKTILPYDLVIRS